MTTTTAEQTALLEHINAVQKGATAKIFLRSEETITDQQISQIVASATKVGEVRVFTSNRGKTLKFFNEELRNSALPQMRKYVRSAKIPIRLVASLTPM